MATSGDESRPGFGDVLARASREAVGRPLVMIIFGVVMLVSGVARAELFSSAFRLGFIAVPVALGLFQARGDLYDERGLGRQPFDALDWAAIVVISMAILGLLVAAVPAA